MIMHEIFIVPLSVFGHCSETVTGQSLRRGRNKAHCMSLGIARVSDCFGVNAPKMFIRGSRMAYKLLIIDCPNTKMSCSHCVKCVTTG